MKKLENKLGNYFNIMAVIRTVLGLLGVGYVLSSCVLPEYMTAEQETLWHLQHTQINESELGCPICKAEIDDMFNNYWE